MTSVVVADDTLLVREAVARIVERAPSLRLLGSCADGDEPLRDCAQLLSRLVLPEPAGPVTTVSGSRAPRSRPPIRRSR